nr:MULTISPECIES: pyrroline-5-carboxylate reductase [unclassified Paenibacillus]
MRPTIGFIGSGKMAQAMIAGMLRDGSIAREQLIVSARTEQTLQRVKDAFGIAAVRDNRAVAGQADVLFLAVAPNLYDGVIAEIAESVRAETVVVSIAAGITIARVEKAFGKPVKIVRGMPNTPSLIGSGVTAVCANESVTPEESERVAGLLRSIGEVELIREEQMDAIPPIAASSPAYVYMLIEAMADGGVRLGLPRAQAYRLAAQAVLGAARMVLETGKHPGELKDGVCTPGGATIAAVATLEQEGFRGTVMAAMQSCYERVKELGE